MSGSKLSWSRSYVLRYVHLNIQYIYCLLKWSVVSFLLTRTNDFYNVNFKTNSSCLIETICMNINLLYISYDKLLHWGITWFYGDISDVVLRAPLWTDLFRGRIEGWILYLRRGWCGWRFNHDSWIKWGCHDIVTWLTQANTSVGYKNNIFMCYYTCKY